MAIYLIVFFITSLIYFIANKSYKINHVISYSFIFLGSLFLSIFSGIRNYLVGIDILVYGNNIFLDTVNYPISIVIERNKRWADIGYVLINRIVSIFSDSPHVFYGFLTFLVSILAFILISLYKKELSIPFAMTLFLFVLWPLHLNILRQGLAIMILGIGLYFLDKDKYFKALLFAVVGYFIHDSSILVSLIFLSCKLLVKILNKDRKRIALKVAIIILGLGCSLPIIFRFIPLSIMTAFDPKYYYVSNSFSISQFSFSRSLLFSFPVIYYFKRVVKNSELEKESLILMYTISLLNIVFNGFAASNYILFGRISYYFYIPLILFISMCVPLAKEKKSQIIEYIIWIIYGIFIFYALLYLDNYGGLFPYQIDNFIKLLF